MTHIWDKKLFVLGILILFVVPVRGSNQTKSVITVNELLAKIEQGKQIENVIVQEPVSFAYRRFTQEVIIINVEFTQDIDLSHVVFERAVNLNGSIFEKNVLFKEVSALSDLFLNNAIFRGEVDMRMMTVRGEFKCEETQFERGASFNFTKFHGPAYFTRSEFKFNAGFIDVEADVFLSFVDGKFFGKAYFDSMESDRAYFGGGEFFGKTKFSSAEFGGEVCMSEAIFHEEVYYNNMRVGGKLFLRGTLYEKTAYFQDMEAAILDIGESGQKRTRFNQDAIFDRMIITKFARFRNVEFSRNASFNAARIQNLQFQITSGQEVTNGLCGLCGK